jgi:hypothetical protein
MDWTLLQFNLVVLASDNNPTILNPDFLKYGGIVTEELNMEVVGPAITTPAFSTVQYNNGIGITVEPQKIQVADNNLKELDKSFAQRILKSYVKTVPHVNYTAVGINFRLIHSVSDPDGLIKKYLLHTKFVENSKEQPKKLGVKLAYDFNGFIFTLNLNADTLKALNNPKDTITGVVVDANFHHNMRAKQSEAYLEIAEIVDRCNDALSVLKTTLEDLFKE